MHQVRIENKTIKINQIEVPLFSGEIHYWRLDPANWALVLDRAREMGLNVIATYVCWDFHEYEQGKFDFCGETDPRRNLLAFLDLLTEKDFWIILRPGPYIYSEWKNGGVPDWAAKYHRFHPQFQTYAKRYMQAVTTSVLPYLATRGGRIILWQSDNEIDPWPHWYTEELGLGNNSGIFQQFLGQRYKSIDLLNEVWGSSYSSFDQTRAVMRMATDEPHMMRRYLDFARFTHWYVHQVAEWGIQEYKRCGVDVPIYVNTYSGVGTQSWSPLETVADLVGSDIYPSLNFDFRANEHRNFLDAVRYGYSFSRLPYIAEFQSGVWHDWLGDVGMLSASHYIFTCLSALAAGAAGWNWYMLVNRDNWYQSPINEWGRTRPDLYAAFSKIVHLVNSVKPHSLNKRCDLALTYDPLQRATTRPGQELLQALYDAGIDYQFMDMARGVCEQKLLVYAGGSWLSADGQQKLVDYIQNGGHLVCIGVYPYLDDNLQSLNLLEIPEADGIIQGLPVLDLGLSINYSCQSKWLASFDQVPGTAILAQRLAPKNLVAEENQLQWNLQNNHQYVVGFTKQVGIGKLTYLGLQPTPDLIQAVHQYFLGQPLVKTLTSGIQTSVFERNGSYYIFLLNPTHEGKSVNVVLQENLFQKGMQLAFDLIKDVDVDISDKGMLTTYVDAKNATLLEITRRRV